MRFVFKGLSNCLGEYHPKALLPAQFVFLFGFFSCVAAIKVIFSLLLTQLVG
jgi:hypothetical protein